MYDDDDYVEDELVSRDEDDDGLNLDLMYFRVFVGFARRFSLRPSEANVLSVIWSLQKMVGWCYASQATLARASLVSVQTLNAILRDLEKRGFLEKSSKKSRYRTTRWRLTQGASGHMKYILQQITEHRNERD